MTQKFDTKDTNVYDNASSDVVTYECVDDDVGFLVFGLTTIYLQNKQPRSINIITKGEYSH